MRHNKENILNIITIMVFILIIFLPQIVFYFTKDYIETDNSENRKLATKPELKNTSIIEYPKEYEKYYNDNVPFRGIIKKIWTNINFFVFNDSSCDKVVIGESDNKDRSLTWLFYCASSDYNPVAEAQGITKFEDEEKEKIYNNIIENTSRMKENNVQLYYLICPNKENIYKEKFSSNIKILDYDSRTDKLVKELNEKGIDNVIYPKDELMNEKDNNQEYYKQDTHWNNYGAFIGFKKVMNFIEPDYNNFNYEVEYSENKIQNRDLVNMLGINDYFRDVEPTVKYLDMNEYTSNTILTKTNNIFITECKEAPIDKTIMIVGDSYRNAMIQFFARTYKKCIFMHRDDYKATMIEEYTPNILISENVERYTTLLEHIRLYKYF